MVDISSGDGPQDVFERTESCCGFSGNINGNDEIRKRCILAVWIWDLSWVLVVVDGVVVLTHTPRCP